MTTSNESGSASAGGWSFRAPKPSKVERTEPLPEPAAVPQADPTLLSDPAAAPAAAPVTDVTNASVKQVHAAISEELRRAYEPSRVPEMRDVIMTACAEFQSDMLECIHRGSFVERASLCQAQSVKFWKCAQDYKYVLKKMGYPRKAVTDEQRVVMVREANSIVKKAWEMEGETEVLNKFFPVRVAVPKDPPS
ncbi:hypothetical protein H9P43_007509 [Blastocladiella emersonii ATCC 22665]|nr:hypothetical protein H9P43_007509 [Blastocladiella emersonii ATCC 22665]